MKNSILSLKSFGVILFVFISFSLSAQETDNISKTIKGKIKYHNVPLPKVNIIIKGTSKGTKTNTKGDYTIYAKIGDEIQYSYIGFKTITIVIEDVTSILNIEMTQKVNELDEALVTAKKSRILEHSKKSQKKFSTSKGVIDPKSSGFGIAYIDGKDIKSVYPSLAEALSGKFAGITVKNGKVFIRGGSAIWDVDGVIYKNVPHTLDLSNIIDIHILKALGSTIQYGSIGKNGVVVVRTKSGTFDPVEDERKKIAEQYTNKNYYSNDAISINTETLFTNSYTNELQDFNNIQKAFAYYNQTLKDKVQDYSTHISIAQKFVTYYNDTNVASYILNELATWHIKNPEILKAIAYQLQTLNLKKDAIKAYETIFKLRPKYVQSYRDLANAYVGNDQFKKAWRLYMSYLLQGNDISGENIGQLLYNEMEYLYYNRRNQTDIKEHFVPQSYDLFDFRNDVRIVFEWNTSEAEFDLEFVNPEKQAYVFEHSLTSNQNLIIKEKQKGYSSREFFIDDIGNGEWLVNITYNGNKKPEPTYFKVTQYYNWGKANQTKKIGVYKFQNEREKIQLIKLNKQLLIASE